VLQFLARRLGYAVIVLWGVSTITFVLLHLTGDPTLALVPLNATPQAIATIRQAWGFDQPLLVQYVRFLAAVAQGSFGTSTRHRRPAMDLIVERMPATLELAFTSMLVAVLAAVPAGIVAAVRRNTPLETVTMSGALLGLSIPTFWLGIMLILLFGVALRWLPVSGRGTPAHLVLPAVATGMFVMAQIARLVRSTVLEQLKQDYVRTARAKGLIERVVTYKHVLRNAAIPIVTLIGLQFGELLGGAVIIEWVFAWPGVGRFALQAVLNRDFAVVQATVCVVALGFLLINLLVDIIYAQLDPKIRFA